MLDRPTVILADDHPGMLDHLSRILGDRFEIVATASDGIEAVDRALQLQADVVILDFSMPNMNGVQTGRELRNRGCKSAIVFLTIHADPDYMQAVAEIGAGCVAKVRMDTDLIPAINAALRKHS
jgi:DNA-binding NarL/FixJ family response regulator